MPTDPAQLFINTSNDPGLIVGPRVDASGALRYPTDEPQSSNTIVNIIQYNLNTIGANNQVLINKDNVATGDAELTYDANTNILTTETLNVGNLNTAFSANLGNVANVKITGGSNGFVLKTDGSGNLTWASQTVATPTWSSITGKPTFATVATSGDYNDLSNKPTGGATTTYVDNKVANVTWANLSGAPTLANVATSGSYADLSNLPNLMGVALSGNYNDLSNRPSIPSISGLASETYVDNKIANVTYANLSGTPTFATVATSGLYADLTYPTYVAENNLPDAANNAGMFAYVSQTGHGYVSNSTSWVKLGNFDDLPDLTNYALASSVPAEQIQSDWTQTDDEQKDYIKNKPALFSGEYSALANKPSLFSGSYADLTNTPTIPTNLDSLSNVTITSATNGEVLKFNGTDWVNGTPSSELSKTYTAGSVVQNTNLSVQPQEISLNASLDPGMDSFGSAITKVKLDNGAVNISSLEQDFPDIVYKTEINVSYYDGVTITNSPGPDDTKTWVFKNNGQLQLPVGGDIVDSTGTSVLGGGGGASLPLSNGNSIINIASVDGNITLDANGNVFTLGTDGKLTLPASGDIDIPNGRANVTGTANTVGGGATVGVRSILAIDSAFGSNDANDPASAQAIRGRVTGSNLTKTRNYVAGVTGQYLVTGTNASEFINTGLLGVVGDQTTTANAAVVAYLDGDGGLTTAGSAYGVSMKNSTPGSGFDYGLDLQFIDLNVAGTTAPFKQADIRFNNGALQRNTGLVTCAGGASTIVYVASADIQHTIKLLIQVEGLVGSETLPDTQSCEMIIAKSFRGNNVSSTVYAIVHTSVAPLATFTALWDEITNRVEVICTPTGANAVDVKTFATEITAVVT